jgi:hypothetical protein
MRSSAAGGRRGIAMKILRMAITLNPDSENLQDKAPAHLFAWLAFMASSGHLYQRDKAGLRLFAEGGPLTESFLT